MGTMFVRGIVLAAARAGDALVGVVEVAEVFESVGEEVFCRRSHPEPKTAASDTTNIEEIVRNDRGCALRRGIPDIKANDN